MFFSSFYLVISHFLFDRLVEKHNCFVKLSRSVVAPQDRFRRVARQLPQFVECIFDKSDAIPDGSRGLALLVPTTKVITVPIFMSVDVVKNTCAVAKMATFTCSTFTCSSHGPSQGTSRKWSPGRRESHRSCLLHSESSVFVRMQTVVLAKVEAPRHHC